MAVAARRLGGPDRTSAGQPPASALTRCILAGDPMQRSAAVLLLAYLNGDHGNRSLAQACARFLNLEVEAWRRA